MDAEFCIAALEEALARYGPPEIFNTDPGSQFTSPLCGRAEGCWRAGLDGWARPMDGQCLQKS